MANLTIGELNTRPSSGNISKPEEQHHPLNESGAPFRQSKRNTQRRLNSKRILSIIEKEDGSQANSFGSRGVDTLLEYILRNAESGGKALSLAKRDNDSKLGKGLALDDAIGIVETFWNPTEIRYGERVSKAREHIDIVHFHGLSWTNTNREFLQKQLSNPDIEVRVALLDPESPFFAPYADFIDINPDVLKSKYIEVVGIWKKMFKEANAVGNSAKAESSHDTKASRLNRCIGSIMTSSSPRRPMRNQNPSSSLTDALGKPT